MPGMRPAWPAAAPPPKTLPACGMSATARSTSPICAIPPATSSARAALRPIDGAARGGHSHAPARASAASGRAALHARRLIRHDRPFPDMSDAGGVRLVGVDMHLGEGIRADPHQRARKGQPPRSEEHTSELQSRENLVCRLLLEKKNKES